MMQFNIMMILLIFCRSTLDTVNTYESIELPSLSSDKSIKIKNELLTSSPKREPTSKPSLFLALCKTYIVTFLIAGFLKLINDLLNFVGPQILKLVF